MQVAKRDHGFLVTREASVYHRKGAFLVGPLARMRNGPSVSIDPYERIPDTISYAELADAVRSALWRSRVIPDINLSENKLPPLPELAAAGVKSRSTFHRGARLVGVSADGTNITLHPSENEGARWGFVYIDQTITVPELSTSEVLGAALEQAFALCK